MLDLSEPAALQQGRGAMSMAVTWLRELQEPPRRAHEHLVKCRTLEHQHPTSSPCGVCASPWAGSQASSS